MRVLTNVAQRRHKFAGVAFNLSPFFNVYPITSAGALGVKLTNAATLPTNTCNSIRWSRGNGDYVAVGSGASPFVFCYPFSSHLSAGGFGTKFANPATLPTGSVEHTDWNPGNTTIICGHFTSPFYSAYAWSAGGGFGTKYSEPASQGGITVGLDVQFSPDGATIAIGGTAEALFAYPWSDSSGFGTKYADPSSVPGAVHGLDWAPGGDEVVIGESLTPFIQVIPFSAGWGTVYSNPAVIPTDTAFMVKWTVNEEDILAATNLTPFINGWAWSGSGWGSKYSNPATLPIATGSGVDVDCANNNIVMSSTLTPFISIYPWTVGSGFGARRAAPATLPGGSALDAEYNT